MHKLILRSCARQAQPATIPNMSVMGMQATGPQQAPQMLHLYTGPLVWSATKLSNSWKSCHYSEHGHWKSRDHKCTTWWFVLRLCVKVLYNEHTGIWEISARYGGPGCSIQRPSESVSAARIPVPQWRNSTPPLLDSKQVPFLHSFLFLSFPDLVAKRVLATLSLSLLAMLQLCR